MALIEAKEAKRPMVRGPYRTSIQARKVMSYFDAFGPFEIPRLEGRITARQRLFWSGIDDRYSDNSGKSLGQAIGCYVFCIGFGEKLRPWYVGMTVAQRGFKGEIFQSHKLSIYNECLDGRRGVPKMLLFPLITDNEYRFSQAASSKKKEIEWLEITLMGFAHRRNASISNVRDMTFLRNVEVLGLLGRRQGRPVREAKEVRRALLGK